MAQFGRCTNNGLTAVARLEDIGRFIEGEKLKGWIFLFSDSKSHLDKPWVHGDYGMMHRLLENHTVASVFISVPFSVGNHMMPEMQPYVLEQIEQVTPTHQLLKTFGVDLAIPREVELAGSDHNW